MSMLSMCACVCAELPCVGEENVCIFHSRLLKRGGGGISGREGRPPVIMVGGETLPLDVLSLTHTRSSQAVCSGFYHSDQSRVEHAA